MEWKIYLADKTCYVFRDGELLDRFKIFKQQGEGLTVYNRWNADKNDTPSIEKMKLIASTTGEILYDRKKGLTSKDWQKK